MTNAVIDMIAARPLGARVVLTITRGGKIEQFLISRSAAASAIGRIADALAKQD